MSGRGKKAKETVSPKKPRKRVSSRRNAVRGKDELPALYWHACKLAETGQFEQSRDLYGRLARTGGTNTNTRLSALIQNDLATLDAVQGQFDEAEEGWHTALRLVTGPTPKLRTLPCFRGTTCFSIVGRKVPAGRLVSKHRSGLLGITLSTGGAGIGSTRSLFPCPLTPPTTPVTPNGSRSCATDRGALFDIPNSTPRLARPLGHDARKAAPQHQSELGLLRVSQKGFLSRPERSRVRSS
jgi:hypothetical protein